MNQQIERRIRKAEEAAAARQPKVRGAKIMFPPDDGDAAAMASYQQEFDQAICDGYFVIRIVPLQPKA